MTTETELPRNELSLAAEVLVKEYPAARSIFGGSDAYGGGRGGSGDPSAEKKRCCILQ